MTFTSEILTDICIKIVLKKLICKETSCYCSHEIFDPVPIWIVILPFIFFCLLSQRSLFVLLFSPYHLLEKYSSHFKQYRCFYFLQENIRLSVFLNLETEKPDGHLSRESIWWLPAYLLALDSDSSVLYWILSGTEARTGFWDQNDVPDEKLAKPITTGICPIWPISWSENKNSEKVDHLLRPSTSMHSAFVLLVVLLPRFISRLLKCLLLLGFGVLWVDLIFKWTKIKETTFLALIIFFRIYRLTENHQRRRQGIYLKKQN